MKEAVAILCAGGPAPGINTVISSVTKIFSKNGYNVLGLNGGYKSLFADEPEFEYLDFDYAAAAVHEGSLLCPVDWRGGKDTYVPFGPDGFHRFWILSDHPRPCGRPAGRSHA